jgi:vacuolar protein sorting-associated protein 3
MPETSGKRREKKPEGEDLALLEQIQQVSPEAGVQFLEYLVLQRRSTVSHMSGQLNIS